MTRPTERELYRLCARSPIGMYRSTEDGRFLYANQALATMLGYTLEELLAINLNADVYADPDARTRLIARYRESGVIDGERVRWRTRAGRSLTVQIYGHVVEDPGGTTFDASVLDVTEREIGEAQLASHREELERTASTLDMVLRQVPAMYWLVDGDLRILRTGGAIEQVLGYAPDRWVGSTLHRVREVEPGSVDSVAMHQRALAGETLSYQTHYRDKWLANTIAPHRRDGKIVGAIGTAIDITTLRALERRMVDAQRAESLGVLAGGLAHDFNNLLVAILGNADLGLREIPAGAPGHTPLHNIRLAALGAAELTTQLLAYAGRGAVATAPVSPRAVVDELVRITAPNMPSNVRVDVDIADVAILGDASQIRQVILNLVNNARDAFADGGRIVVTSRRVLHDGETTADDIIAAPAGDYVEIVVTDDGPGMDDELRRRVFEPFFTTKSTGHGLGLAAVLGIVRSHEGGLRLVTSPGGGARFVVLWPMATRDAPTTPRSRSTVLVIDDEALVRDVVARMIEDLGYAAVTAADGPAGLDLVDQRHVDAVLVDMTMPRMSGADVVAALRTRRPALPIVLCTGFDRDRKGRVDADAFLPKPFRIEALEQTLAKILR